ncbi:MAG: flagellar biosynthesis protein FlhA, partial [Pirellulales bacterium]|nr:flagellar biosynthesis protein FlhA [Pirellulales bacterium]
MLDWTSTAVVLWDDLSPDALTPYQQQALADWVRFGGSLIINGATATEAISQTALADVLPLRPSGNVELDPDGATQLLRSWSVATDPSVEKQIALLRSQSGRVAVDGQAASDATTVENSGSLILLRRVGHGRVVQPRFDLTSDWLANWASYDSFINGAILARPRRQFAQSQDASDESLIRHIFPDHRSVVPDPAMNTRFRITARDSVLRSSNGQDSSASAISSSRYDPLTRVDPVSGISGWNNNSDTVRLCREILKSESGIEIPDSSLVIRSLGYYLVILVPLPAAVLDLLLAANIAVAVIVLLTAVYVRTPLEFNIFPSLLLATTLVRLVLNVATTR